MNHLKPILKQVSSQELQNPIIRHSGNPNFVRFPKLVIFHRNHLDSRFCVFVCFVCRFKRIIHNVKIWESHNYFRALVLHFAAFRKRNILNISYLDENNTQSKKGKSPPPPFLLPPDAKQVNITFSITSKVICENGAFLLNFLNKSDILNCTN